MTTTPRVSRLTVYPFKSFDGQSIEQAVIQRTGALQHDRRWALVDLAGKFVNAKRTARIHRLRSEFNVDDLTVRLRDSSELLEASPDSWEAFHVDRDRAPLEEWLSRFFEHRVLLREDPVGGFPDDIEAAGPTVVSVATLETIASWFPGIAVDEVRRRFRANIEIDGVEPFWEDRLFGLPGTLRPFRLGPIGYAGTNPCQRCPVPTRNPSTGEVWHGFQKEFARRREEHLPPWAEREQFNHFYRLTVNTRLLDLGGGLLKVGDEVTL